MNNKKKSLPPSKRSSSARKTKAKRAGPPRKGAPTARRGKRPGPKPEGSIGTARRPVAPRPPGKPAKPGVAAAPPAPVAPAKPDEARPTAMLIAQAGLDKKAEDVTVLDVRGLTSYADYFVVMTADSDRQASAIADAVEQTMKEKGVTKVGVEGYEGGRWILVDYGDVVAHVMNKESRGFYDLEGLWADAPRFTVSD
jgi:ribosome-associated protein